MPQAELPPVHRRVCGHLNSSSLKDVAAAGRGCEPWTASYSALRVKDPGATTVDLPLLSTNGRRPRPSYRILWRVTPSFAAASDSVSHSPLFPRRLAFPRSAKGSPRRRGRLRSGVTGVWVFCSILRPRPWIQSRSLAPGTHVKHHAISAE
jgi:hypothetical protein